MTTSSLIESSEWRLRCIASLGLACSRRRTRALGIELAHQGMRIETNRHIPMAYRGELIGDIPDLIVESTVVVEVKSVSHLEPVFTAEVVTYLRLTNLRVGLLLNFDASKLVDGLKRVVL